MNESRISVRYSRAIFQSALDKKILEKVNQDMILIRDICNIPEVKELLSSPIIRPSKKAGILHKIFGGDLQKLTGSMIDLVVKNGRERYIPAIARAFIHKTMEFKGTTECFLTTAVEVDSEIKKQISDLISAAFKTKADLKEIIDESIIGGFILKVSDNYIDASVKNKLRKIKKELSPNETGSRF